MNDLDEQLKVALARPEPPAGFADRVLARVAAEATAATEPEANRAAEAKRTVNLAVAPAAIRAVETAPAPEAKKFLSFRPRRGVVLQGLAAAALVTIASGGMWRLLSREANDAFPSEGIGPRVIRELRMVAPVMGLLAANETAPGSETRDVVDRAPAARTAAPNRNAAVAHNRNDALVAVERAPRRVEAVAATPASEDAESRRAAEQVLVALRLTNAKLDEAKQLAFNSLKRPDSRSLETNLENP